MWQYKLENQFDLTLGLNHENAYDQKLIARGKAQMHTAEILLHRLSDSAGIILGDEVGMGKTWVALLASISIAQTRPVLVLTPSRVLSRQWRKQYLNLIEQKLVTADKNLKKELKELLVEEDSFTDIVQAAKKFGKGIYVCPVGSIKADATYRCLDGVGELFELVVLDEGHNFKNPGTLKYQIFKTTRTDRNFKQPMAGKMARILILTATPFQLGHQELEGVLNIVEATNASSEMKLKFKTQLDSTLMALNKYKTSLGRFEHQFRNLVPAENTEFLSFVDLAVAPQLPRVCALVRQLAELKEIKDELNRGLMNFIVRNSKDKSHRQESGLGITLDQSQQLLFFITEQLGKVRRREAPGATTQLPAIESSYARFEDHLAGLQNIGQKGLAHYRDLTGDLFNSHYKNTAHPKMDAIVQKAFDNYLRGEKTLIFCFYIKTLNRLEEEIQVRVREYLESKKAQALEKFGPQANTFNNYVGIASKIESLVFKDNIFSVSLMPIIRANNLDPLKLLVAKEDEQKEIVNYLLDIGFNENAPNFQKLTSAFTHFAFRKFSRKHKALIPADLKDDFEYILEPENLQISFKRKDKITEETQLQSKRSERRPGVSKYIADLIANEKELTDLMVHPTVWSHHAKELASLDIETRIQITDIITSYLTGDEFLFVELLPQFQKMPTHPEIVESYRNSNLTAESTYMRVCRFLETARTMAEENLELLAVEMNHRYHRNKSNMEKMIVEKVDGGDDQTEKDRNITAFRTPFPPYVLVSTSVLAEGVDLHTECRHVCHYDHEWNPAALEQKTGRVDRVGSKSERLGASIEIDIPYIKHTQDEKAYRVVMARKSWFDAVMGEKYDDRWGEEDTEKDSLEPLPEKVRQDLKMNLDNDAHAEDMKTWKKVG